MRIEDGQFKLDGYPEGSVVRGIAGPKPLELCRLVVFRGDLTNVCEWLMAANAEGVPPTIHEALCAAALVKFCSCFEGTSGLRAKPLKRKNIFAPADRAIVERLRQIRNKLVAHNENLYPGEFPLIVLDSDANAIEAVALKLEAPFSVMPEVADLSRLSAIALGWVAAEFEAIATEVVAGINAIPISERRLLRDTTPEFTLNILSEDRF